MTKICCDITPEFGTCIDTHTQIICKELTILDCGSGDCEVAVVNNGLYLCECTDSWNCQLCANDLPFWNVVETGDSIFLQFQQIDQINGQDPNVPPVSGWDSGFVTGEIYDCCEEDPIATIITNFSNAYFVGTYPVTNYDGSIDYFNIQQIELDVDLINALFADQNAHNCFYFKFRFSTGGENYEELCTEPFKFNPCPDVNKSVMIEADFNDSSKDCFGYYYGLPSSWVGTNEFRFVNQYRVQGAFELLAITLDKEIVNKFLVATNVLKCELYRFATIGVPEKIALLIANQFAAKQIFINEKQYQITKELSKNNEIGNQWFLETELKTCDCYRDYSCS